MVKIIEFAGNQNEVGDIAVPVGDADVVFEVGNYKVKEANTKVHMKTAIVENSFL